MAEQRSPIAMATPTAVLAVGALCVGFWALLTGMVSPAAIPAIAAWCLTVATIVFICGILEMVRGDILLGSTCLILAGLIGMGGGMSFNAIVSQPVEAWPAGLAQSGWVWVAVGVIVFALLPVYGKVSWSLFVFMIELGVILELLAYGLITGVGLGTGTMVVTGWLLLIFAAYCIYAGTVFITNIVYGAPKLPIGGPIYK
jgi:hypothetical protein